MTTAAAPTAIAGSRPHSRPLTIAPAVATAAITSIGAGAIHAAAIGVHSEHRQAVITFTILAIAQLGWGVLALCSAPGWFIARRGIAINTAAVVGWVMAKTDGISFIDGLDVAEGAQFADTTATVLAAIAVVGAVVALFMARPAARGTDRGVHRDRGRRRRHHRLRDGLGREPLARRGRPRTTAATPRAGDGHAHGGTTGGDPSGGHAAAVVPPKEYDPTEADRPRRRRRRHARAAGPGREPDRDHARCACRSGPTPPTRSRRVSSRSATRFTGDEHFVNQAYFNDGNILDPDYPESLVYEPAPATARRSSSSAMFMMAPADTGTTSPTSAAS